MRKPRLAPLFITILAGCAATPAGELVSNPWPRLAETWQPVPKPEKFHHENGALAALAGNIRYEASRAGDGIIRVRVARNEFDTIPSFAVSPPPRRPAAAPDAEIEAAAREAIGRLMFTDGPGWRWFRALEPREHVVGLGERPGSMHQRGRRAVMWNTDNFSYAPDAERLYQSIPFWISLKRGRARGFFIDNTHRLGFDVGASHPEVLEVAAEDGDFDLYLIEGPTPREVVERFSALTGRPPLPPLWALGYQQCRWSYDNQDWVLRVAREFREHKIPCDVIYTDIDYMDDYRSFTIDRERFPDFAGMARELGGMGFKVVSIIDPGIKYDTGWNIYNEGSGNGYFIKTPEGAEYRGRVWPGKCAFPDFTREDVREWWGELYKPLVDAGVAGFWNDMNEPAIFDGRDKTMPEDCLHALGPHRKFHNVYGMLMARATREGIVKLRPERRPFVLTRANYAGGQRYAATWTGDNAAKWAEVERSIGMTLNLGLCGQPFAGPDIGGFNTKMEGGGKPFPDCTAELHARWLEFGALLPIARSHTIKGSMDREPYAYGEPWTAINRASIERRYRLLPYIYTLAEEAHRTGVPIARPLFWISPDDERAIRANDEFLLGDALLVAPVVDEGASARDVYLPAGAWYPYDPNEITFKPPIAGPAHITVSAPPGKLPMFARAGAIVPAQPIQQFVGAPLEMLDSTAPLELHVFAGDGKITLYEDAGDGPAAGGARCSRWPLSVTNASDGPVLSAGARTENYLDWNRSVKVIFYGPAGLAEATFADDGLPHDARPPRGDNK